MEIEIENLKAQMQGFDLNIHQRADACIEFNKLLDYVKELEQLSANEDTKEVNIFELIREELDDWVFGVETQAGVKLKLVDSADFNEIIINIRDKFKT